VSEHSEELIIAIPFLALHSIAELIIMLEMVFKSKSLVSPRHTPWAEETCTKQKILQPSNLGSLTKGNSESKTQ